MCLTTNNKTIKTAKKDIYVFKSCHGVDECQAISQNCNIIYKVGEATPFVKISPKNGYGGTYEVEAGYHSYNKPIKDNINTLFKIPRGTSYIDGWFNSDSSIKNRVSSSIVYVKEVNYNKFQRWLINLGIMKP